MPEISQRRRRLILGICCLSLFIVGVDNTIVNVALPTIARGLNASVSGLQWIVDGYTMVLASLVMSAGAAADRFGRRRVFLVGLVLFTVSSGLCSTAPSLGWLVTFRVLQAVGGSMLNPVAVSIISDVFKDRAERAWAIGIWVSVFGVSMALGPVLGGILVGTVGWRGIFWVNIPVGLAAIALTARFIPESRSLVRRRPDPVAQALVIIGLASLIYAIIEGPRTAWHATSIIGLFGLAAGAFVALLLWELGRTDPLIDPRYFRRLPFTGAVLTGLCGFGSLGGFLFLGTIYLQDVRGLSALDAGLHMLPTAAGMAICPLPAARLAARYGLRLPLTIGGAALTLSMAAMSWLTVSSSNTFLIAAFLVFGIGLGMIDGQISTAAVSAMPPSQAGLASGIASASRQMGQALGVAVSGSILNANARGLVAATFVDASRPAWLVLTGCGCVVLLLGLAARRTRSPHITARLDAEVPQAVLAREGEPRPELETQADQVPQADPWPWTPGDQEAWIPEDQQAPPESAWIPRYLISQRPAYFAPESRDPLVIVQGDHPYYRRLRQARHAREEREERE
jgi:EmrB/QacA subfamily drug resistance transporter